MITRECTTCTADTQEAEVHMIHTTAIRILATRKVKSHEITVREINMKVIKEH